MAKAVAVTAADLDPTNTRPKSAMRQRGVTPSADLVPLQFRMPPEFCTRFQTVGARPRHETLMNC